MIIYGYAKSYRYTSEGTLQVTVRIPSIHGPYKQTDANGKVIRNYTLDDSLPEYPSLLLPQLPNDGDVVALASPNSTSTDWIVIGLTGGSYASGNNIPE